MPTPTIFDLLRQAIDQKKQVIATYNNLPREMCPHVLGYKDANPQCLFYQFAGKSSRGLFPIDSPEAFRNWRCLFLSELSNVQLRDGDWYSISKHTKPQTCVDLVTIEVAGWI